MDRKRILAYFRLKLGGICEGGRFWSNLAIWTFPESSPAGKKWPQLGGHLGQNTNVLLKLSTINRYLTSELCQNFLWKKCVEIQLIFGLELNQQMGA